MDCTKESNEESCTSALHDLINRITELEKSGSEKSAYIKRLESAILDARSKVFDKPTMGYSQ